MHKDALAALFAAGMEDGYAPLISDDSPIRIWRLGNGSGSSSRVASGERREQPVISTYQLEVPLTIGQAWSHEISEQEASKVKAALDRVGVGYLTELG
jgi:hypothetical protein